MRKGNVFLLCTLPSSFPQADASQAEDFPVVNFQVLSLFCLFVCVCQLICRNSTDHELFDLSIPQNYVYIKNEKIFCLTMGIKVSEEREKQSSNLHEKS